MMDWSTWIQDTVNDLFGYLEAINNRLEELVRLAEEQARHDGNTD